MKQTILYLFIVSIFITSIYFLTKIGKKLSYKFFYEDQVIETVNDILKRRENK